MKTKTNGIRLATIAIGVLFTCHAIAANVACPSATDIKQSGTSDEGTNYTATTSGYTWTGEVSKYDDDVNVESLRFVSASIVPSSGHAGRNFVACDYHGDGRSSLRMTSDMSKSFDSAASSNWTKSKSEPAICKDADPAKCEFKEQ